MKKRIKCGSFESFGKKFLVWQESSDGKVWVTKEDYPQSDAVSYGEAFYRAPDAAVRSAKHYFELKRTAAF